MRNGLKIDQFCDKKFLYRCLGTIVAMCIAMKVSGGALFVLFIPAIMASVLQRKTEKLMFWLIAAIGIIIVNPAIAPKNFIFAMSQRALLVTMGVCMAVQVFGRKTHKLVGPYMGMILYVFYMVVPSVMGWCPIVSLLKLFLFTIIYFALLGSVNFVGIDNSVSSKRIRSIMLTFAIFFLFGSIALTPFPGYTQMNPEQLLAAQAMGVELRSLYCGLANHSQCLGPIVSALGVVLLGDMLFSIKQPHKLYMGLLLTCPYLIYRTSSRTGMGSFILGTLFVTYLFTQARGVSATWKSKVLSMVMILVAVGGAAVLCSPKFSQGIEKFAAKSADTGDATSEHILSSRMGLIQRSMYNFKQSPLVGNGFQVSDEMQGYSVDDIKKVLSAPIEKGVWIFAVLEEGGVLGWLLFVGFFTACILTSIRNRAYIAAATLFTTLMSNLGEFSIFSMSYAGGFCWSMVFMGLALDIQRNKDERMGRCQLVVGRW